MRGRGRESPRERKGDRERDRERKCEREEEREIEREREREARLIHTFARQARLMRDSFNHSQAAHANLRTDSRGRRRKRRTTHSNIRAAGVSESER